MGNLVKIETKTAPSGGVSNFQFSSIPSTYQDIFIVLTARSNRSNAIDAIKVYFNTDTTTSNYSILRAYNSTTTITTQRINTYADEFAYISGNSATAGDFGSTYLYMANYSGSLAKSINMRSGGSDNSSSNARSSWGSLSWTGTAAVNQITIAPNTGTLFQEFSTATLYGVVPQVNTTSGSKATGGIITTSGGYTYHTFKDTGNFIPTTNITGAEVLIVAGGGGAGAGNSWAAGGGGAGGLVYASSLSLSSGVRYPVIVGAGGTGGYGPEPGKNGNDSSFASQTVALGGGGGGGYQGGGASTYAAQVGGSGGGAESGQNYGGTASGAAGTSGQGNAGGGGRYNPNMTGGGGGGAGAVGGTATTTAAGNGGNGSSTYSAWGLATGTGHLVSGTYYYAGGGGGSSGGLAFNSTIAGSGGLGGGGHGAGSYALQGGQGLPYTGGGGGAQPRWQMMVGSGGSGVVIVRYTT